MGAVAKYCVEYVCLSVCLAVRLSVRLSAGVSPEQCMRSLPNFLCILHGHGSGLRQNPMGKGQFFGGFLLPTDTAL